MLQNESLDEELEHFEDVIEPDNEPSSVSSKQKDDVAVAKNGEDPNADASSSESEDDLPAASEDDDSDDDDDGSEDAGFLLAKDETVHKESKKSKSVSNSESQQSQLSAENLRGGYDPRHREPSYWYLFDFSITLVVISDINICNIFCHCLLKAISCGTLTMKR